MKRFTLFLLALIGLTSLIAACANQGAGPDGGPYDETPPRIVGMTAPERLQNGKRTKFSLVFNELIKVDNPTEKIIVSPPQIETPEIKVSGRRITVELLDSMRPNTTYTVDFSDAITDNNEGNPLGQYTYIFSTGQTTDTMQMSGYVLNAEDLEPVKGILAGLYQQHHDSVFALRAFDRVARTDASGFFSIKGVAPDRNYRLYALQDADGDFHFTQPSEMVGFLHTDLRAGAFRDTRYDTLWVDSVRYDSIRIIPYTHFTPDDLVVRAFKIDVNTRHYLKAQRDVPEWFTTFFTGPSRKRPTIQGLNFDARKAFVVNASAGNDTLTYWLADTTLLRQDTLRFAYTYDNWDDSLAQMLPKTDTLELVPKTTFAKRAANEAKELEKWNKQREKREKRGDFSKSQPPMVALQLRADVSSSLVPNRNILIQFDQPLQRFDTKKLHLRLKKDSTYHDAPYALDTVPNNILAYRLRAEWRPGQEYQLVIDSAAMTSLYGRVNLATDNKFSIAKLEDFGTVFLSLSNAHESTVVQLLGSDGKPVAQAPTKNGRAEFYYVQPGKYYLRCFFDRNGDGKWTTGSWSPRRDPEEVYYFPKEIEVRANWDLNESWDVTALRLDKQKPDALVKQRSDKQKIDTHQRNIERLRQRGE
ncbi:Ig-like domain-containing domain [Ihuprevotella massiliensis]|uniref:Ig-like domain-containing domain n=1 Tax=Ihuprevotella massiliensis TaxID=1852368 RepID=UPI00094F3794